MPSFRLDGRVALVTGGSRGLGLGIALALAEYGADIALAARGADELERAAEAVRRRGRRATTITANIGAREAPDMLVTRTTDALGRLDILVNGAGINLRKPAASFARERCLCRAWHRRPIHMEGLREKLSRCDRAIDIKQSAADAGDQS